MTSEDPSTAHRLEFRRLLTNGLGRPMLLIEASPANSVQREELLRACRTDLRHDRQCEVSRAPYLYRLVLATGDAPSFLDELSALLAETADAEEDDAPAQMFEILCLAAKQGANVDRASLRRYLARADFDEVGDKGLTALIDLEGIDALAFAAVCQREALSRNVVEDGGWMIESYLGQLAEREGAEAAAANLEKARAQYPELDALLTLKENAPPFVVGSKATDLDYDAVRALLANGGWPNWRWSETASDEDILRAANDLLKEGDERRILFYLRMFWRRKFPVAPSALFPFLRHSNKRIHWAAARVLGQIRDAEIRALALELLGSEETRAVALKLLYDNFELGDIRRLETCLEASNPDPATWEVLGSPIFNLFDRNSPSPEEIRPLLLRLYENLPCALCRYKAVERLIATGGAPAPIVRECRYDANPETAALFPIREAE